MDETAVMVFLYEFRDSFGYYIPHLYTEDYGNHAGYARKYAV